MIDYEKIVAEIKTLFQKSDTIPLHEPRFIGNERKYVLETIDSTFVSSVGPFVIKFEEKVKEFTNSRFAIATVNGTCALHIALILSKVQPEEEVITQAITFVATANAISYCGAKPIFIDSDRKSLGMSGESLEEFLATNAIVDNRGCINKNTGRRIAACIPMHVFGHPVNIGKIHSLCQNYQIPLIEDAAESIGSFYKEKHTGTFGLFGILSFNGNKTITTGGGGMIITNNENLGHLAKHITTTAKIPHKWDFFHDRVGYNYRLPNINAALGCAQMEVLGKFLEAKRKMASAYRELFKQYRISCITEPLYCRSNYWLNAILLNNREERDEFLNIANKNGVMTRPLWRLMPDLPMYKNCQTDSLQTARWLEDRVVNLPSSVVI